MPIQTRIQRRSRSASRFSSPGYEEVTVLPHSRAQREGGMPSIRQEDREVIMISDSEDEEEHLTSRSARLPRKEKPCAALGPSSIASEPMVDLSFPPQPTGLRRSARNAASRGKPTKSSTSKRGNVVAPAAQKRRSLSPSPSDPSLSKKVNRVNNAEDKSPPTKGKARALSQTTPSRSCSPISAESLPQTYSSAAPVDHGEDAQSYKTKFESLEAKYNSLESKYVRITAEHATLVMKAATLEEEKTVLTTDRNELQRYAGRTEELLTCGVCMDIHLRPFTLDPCGHSCCLRCLHPWLAQNRTCPLCAVHVKKAFPNSDMNSLAKLFVEKFPAKAHEQNELNEAETLFMLTKEGSGNRNFARLLPRHAMLQEDDDEARRFQMLFRQQIPMAGRADALAGHHAPPAPADRAPPPIPAEEPPRAGGGLFHLNFLLGR